jgi:dihydropteroate synthase
MTINCNGQLIDLTVPKVMGILNVTPNSFFDGGKYTENEAVLRRVAEMIAEGADLVDLGAYSSRPNAEFVSEAEELARIVPIVSLILSHFPNATLSIDTFRSEIAKACVDAGASVINDISAGSLDDKMMQTVAALRVPYIMMHMRGTPQNMQSQTEYTDITGDLLLYFSEKIRKARSLGIDDLIIDPGFGFAKTMAQNYELLQKLELFNMTGLPLLAGVSRKSMIYKPLGLTAEDALNGTTVLNTIALSKGAKILRVHDVKEAVECVKLFSLANLQN